MITASDVRASLSYDPETGYFCRNGRRVGTLNKAGYRVISLRSKLYYEHRLAWMHVHGTWPRPFIDHINGNRSDNRISNLRLATAQQNQRNRRRRRDCSSGFKGVRAHKSSGTWFASIVVDHKVISLGYHKTPELAHAAYVSAAQSRFGAFARTK